MQKTKHPKTSSSQLKRRFLAVEQWLRKHQVAIFWGTLLLAFLIALSRRPETVTQAQFWAEDGKYWYAQAYNHGWSVLLETYGGYFVVLYRLVAQASLLAPFHTAPLFFNLAALGIQLLPVVLLCSNRLRSIIPYRSLGIALALVYILVPNSGEVFANLTNIQWHLGVASFLVLIAGISQRWQWKVFDVGVLLATGLSGPLVIVLWPIAFYLWFKKRSQTNTKRNLILLTVLSILQALSILIISHYPRVGGQPDADLLNLIKMLVGQVFMGGLMGIEYVNAFYEHTWLMVLVLISGLSLTIYAVAKGPVWLKLANAYSLFLIVSMLMSLRPTPDFDTWWGLTNPGGGQRYWYIPILIWIVTVVWLAFAAKARAVRVIGFGLLGLLLFVGIPHDWDIAPMPYLDFQQHARTFEQLPSGSKYSVPVNPGWEMILVKK